MSLYSFAEVIVVATVVRVLTTLSFEFTKLRAPTSCGKFSSSMEVNMPILIRLALNCGLFCVLWHAAFPGIPLPVPGYGDPFLEVAFFVLVAIAGHEFWSCCRGSRSSNKKPDQE
jgi:hypothetical protein